MFSSQTFKIRNFLLGLGAASTCLVGATCGSDVYAALGVGQARSWTVAEHFGFDEESWAGCTTWVPEGMGGATRLRTLLRERVGWSPFIPCEGARELRLRCRTWAQDLEHHKARLIVCYYEDSPVQHAAVPLVPELVKRKTAIVFGQEDSWTQHESVLEVPRNVTAVRLQLILTRRDERMEKKDHPEGGMLVDSVEVSLLLPEA